MPLSVAPRCDVWRSLHPIPATRPHELHRPREATRRTMAVGSPRLLSTARRADRAAGGPRWRLSRQSQPCPIALKLIDGWRHRVKRPHASHTRRAAAASYLFTVFFISDRNFPPNPPLGGYGGQSAGGEGLREGQCHCRLRHAAMSGVDSTPSQPRARTNCTGRGRPRSRRRPWELRGCLEIACWPTEPLRKRQVAISLSMRRADTAECTPPSSCAVVSPPWQSVVTCMAVVVARGG